MGDECLGGLALIPLMLFIFIENFELREFGDDELERPELSEKLVSLSTCLDGRPCVGMPNVFGSFNDGIFVGVFKDCDIISDVRWFGGVVWLFEGVYWLGSLNG